MAMKSEDIVKAHDLLPLDQVLYQEREVPGKGIGVFSTAYIPSGTRVLAEFPLFVLSDDADILTLYRAVKGLPGQDQEQFWNLAASVKYLKSREWISSLRLDRGWLPPCEQSH